LAVATQVLARRFAAVSTSTPFTGGEPLCSVRHDARRVLGMPVEPAGSDDEVRQVAEATAFLELNGIPANAREFRLRQEFFRHGWDVRVRELSGTWSVHAVKPDRPDATAHGTTEGNAARRALAEALRIDAASGSFSTHG
jgi:hypothetical protein